LAAEGAFEQTLTFEDLADRHVAFDELVGDELRESTLAQLLVRDRPTKIAISGPSGAGKSSLMAATLEALPAHLALPIAIAQADLAILESQTLFGQFILREIVRQASNQFALQGTLRRRRSERIIAAAVADEVTTARGGVRLAARLNIPALHPKAPSLGQIAAEVSTAAGSYINRANPSDSLKGISEVMRVFAPETMPTPVLIIDDADKWASSYDLDEVDRRAQALFTTALQPLLFLDFHLVVAVQDHWPKLAAYENLAKLLTETIEIPEFAPDATPALRRIIAWHGRLPVDGPEGVDGLLDPGALARLEAEYDHTRRDLRTVLRTVDRAVKNAARQPTVPERLSHTDIRSAARA
jgi:hypothetical protein